MNNKFHLYRFTWYTNANHTHTRAHSSQHFVALKDWRLHPLSNFRYFFLLSSVVPLKAAKNLSTALNIPMTSPPSPIRPDSRGNGNVSSGSTTVSANSSPGEKNVFQNVPPVAQRAPRSYRCGADFFNCYVPHKLKNLMIWWLVLKKNRRFS